MIKMISIASYPQITAHSSTHIIIHVSTTQYVVTANSTSLQSLRESFNVTVGPVTSLAASPNGSLLYVLTPNKVMILFIVDTIYNSRN